MKGKKLTRKPWDCKIRTCKSSKFNIYSLLVSNFSIQYKTVESRNPTETHFGRICMAQNIFKALFMLKIITAKKKISKTIITNAVECWFVKYFLQLNGCQLPAC